MCIVSKGKYIYNKNKDDQPLILLEIHCSTEKISLKVLKISLLIELHVIDMQLYYKRTPLRHHQEIFTVV